MRGVGVGGVRVMEFGLRSLGKELSFRVRNNRKGCSFEGSKIVAVNKGSGLGGRRERNRGKRRPSGERIDNGNGGRFRKREVVTKVELGDRKREIRD